MIDSDNILKTLLELVSVKSITGTTCEYLAAEKIYKILSNIEYFKLNNKNLKLITIENDVLKRPIVSALYKSKIPTKHTVILTGHYDVVDIDEFSLLKDKAFEPNELIKNIHLLNLDEDAKKDVNSGEWIFGRGTADMKYGLALHIEILKYLSQKDNFIGNILFIAVPGEESNSEGMLAAVNYLKELQNTEKYKFVALLLSECCIPKYKGDTHKYIYTGTVGKIMPLLFVCGEPSHVCEPFNGISSTFILSEINKLIEYNINLCDSHENDYTPPPVCLKMMDLKTLYSVQTSLYSAAYYNLITYHLNSEELIRKLKEICHLAFNNVLKIFNDSYKQYRSEESVDNIKIIEPFVITFEELKNQVILSLGKNYDKIIREKIFLWENSNLDIQTISINIIKETFEMSNIKRPTIVIAFAPPFYPDKSIDKDFIGINLMKCIDKCINYAKDTFNEKIIVESYFKGICDLSYTDITEQLEIESVFNNMPGAFINYDLPIENLKKLHIPSVVFGGYGKDFHKNTERLNRKYSLEIVPKLYLKLIYDLLKID